MATEIRPFRGRLYCENHGLLTCKVCLHSINAGHDGSILDPKEEPFPCSDSALKVEPLFERFVPTIQHCGYHDGLSPEDKKEAAKVKTKGEFPFAIPIIPCDECRLAYLSTNGSVSNVARHPAHVSADGQRYIQVSVRPQEVRYEGGQKFKHSVDFFFHAGRIIQWTFVTGIDGGGVLEWNRDNCELYSLRYLLFYVQNNIIREQSDTVMPFVYSNSRYFEEKATHFTLVVRTPLSTVAMDTLLNAHKMKFNAKRQAFIRRNMVGIVTKVYPVTELRRFLIQQYIQRVKELAEHGVQVLLHQKPVDPDGRPAGLSLIYPDSTLERDGQVAIDPPRSIKEDERFDNEEEFDLEEGPLPEAYEVEAIERQASVRTAVGEEDMASPDAFEFEAVQRQD
ncbi:hypothetical protein GGR54DRAFT_116036 [Hypoxylon sp. NC1633]|nr:hypothetical protein GGR54DRAFT_116036 [Hypoxylon sp. NC1633]